MKRWIGLLLVFCFVVGCTTGCKETKTEEEYDCYIYALNNNETALTKFGYNYSESNIEAKINELVNQLRFTDLKGDFLSAIPSADYIVGWTLTATGTVICNFTSKYLSMSTTREVLARACIVKTLCQVGAVSAVEFRIENAPLIINNVTVGEMKANLFLDDIGLNVLRSSATVYYATKDYSELEEVLVSITRDDNYTNEQRVLMQLIEGTVPEGYQRTIPTGTKINRIVTKDNICYVDLSAEFMNYLENCPAELTVYSIVNTLCGLDSVTNVVFTVDGETKEFYLSLELDGMFEYSFDYVKSEE